MNMTTNRRLTLSALLGAAMIFWHAPQVSATIYQYNAISNSVPAAQGWSVAGTQVGIQTVSGGILSVTDASAANRDFSYYTNAFSVALTSTSQYQARSIVRVLPNATGTNPLFTQGFDDQTRFVEYGVRYITGGVGTNRFVFNTSSLVIDVPAGPFYEAVLTKTGTTGTAADSVTLQVFDSTGNTLLGSLTRPYGADGFGTLSTTEKVLFGNFFGSPTGTFETKWATFGIGEAAPFLIPEPSTALLFGCGALILYGRRRRS